MSRRMTPEQQLQEVPHIVKEFKHGATTIKIADNYCVQTQEEVDAILDRCAKIAMGEYRRNPKARERAMMPESY